MFILKSAALRRTAIVEFIFILSALGAMASDKTLSPPSDDRWHYPFNGTPGTRPSGPTFTSNPAGPFNYRDAMVYLRFRPETANTNDPQYIRPGLAPQCYQFSAVKVVVYHNNALAYTWDTRGNTTDTLGNPFQLQVFGMGNNDALTMTHPTQPFTLATWVETSPFYGKLPGPGATERSPYPLNIDALAAQQNVTDVGSSIPWGFGAPVYGNGPGEYTPGTLSSQPFPITYTLNLAYGRVRQYIQEGLAKGRIELVLSSTATPPGPGPQPSVPDFVMKENTLNLPAQLILEDFSVAPTQSVTLARPTDDRWHYPFNGTPGTRTLGPIFSSDPSGGFNYRDAMDLFRFRPNTTNPLDPEYIQPGLPLSQYRVVGAKLTVYSPPSAGPQAFTWDTRDTVTSDSLGNLQMIQLFGMGNNDPLTMTHPTEPFTLASWVETSPFFGAVPFPGSTERSPYPLNLDDLAPTQNVTDDPAAIPWALGEPVYGSNPGEYAPGVIAAAPFPITFTLDLGNERIRSYIKQGLQNGWIDWVIAGTFNSSMGGGTQYPQIIMKDNSLNLPAKLELEFCVCPPNAVSEWSYYE